MGSTSGRTFQEGLCDVYLICLLAKAFRGELVPQDPHDEPAAALLERIRTERAGQSQGQRSSRQLALSL